MSVKSANQQIRLAISSDNHLDVNHLDVPEVIKYQAEYLVKQQVNYYFIAGDLFNDFTLTLDYVEQLHKELGFAVPVYFIAGNHDMLAGVTFQELESELSSSYLHHKILRIPGRQFSVVGNNGWYDYTLADQLAGLDQSGFAKWKQAYWIDQRIDSPLSDKARMSQVLSQVTADLEQVKVSGDEVLFITHFVPRRDYIFDQLDHSSWQKANGMMGSRLLGECLKDFRVRYAAFGHLHTRSTPRTLQGTTYFHQPVGYGLHRLNEWQSDHFMTEWRNTLVLLDI